MLRCLAKGTPVLTNSLIGSISLVPETLEHQSRRWGHPRGFKPPKCYFWDYDYLEKITDGKYTHQPLRMKKLGGRDPITRKKVNKHVGGGVKFDYFMIDTHRRGPDKPGETYDERVIEVRRDPNRTSHIALVAGLKGKRWIYATQNMEAGQIIRTSCHIPHLPVIGIEGNAYPLGALAEGSIVNTVELLPSADSPVTIIQAGGKAEVIRHQGDFTIVKMPNNHEYALHKECMATVGKLSHEDWSQKIWGSAQMHRRFGYRMACGTKLKKDGYQGRKIRNPPPVRTVDKPPPPPQELQKFTLTRRQLSHKFGPGAAHKLAAEFNNLVFDEKTYAI